MDAVVLAGGRGTRLRPLTDTRPKPLLPFLGEPFALGLLRRLAAAGCDTATFLVGVDPTPWQSLVEPASAFGVTVHVLVEETPLDTAGAARRLFAHRRPHGPVLVCNGDICTDLDLAALVASHVDENAVATLALTRVEDTSSFGVVVTDATGRVGAFIEKPPPGTVDADTVNAGTYVLSPSAFDPFDGDGRLSFERDVFPGLVAAGQLVRGVATDAYWQDLGTPERYLQGHRDALEGRCDWPLAPWMRRSDDKNLVAEDADVHPDARLGPYVVVGRGCRIGATTRISGAVLHDGVVVAGGVVEDAILSAE